MSRNVQLRSSNGGRRLSTIHRQRYHFTLCGWPVRGMDVRTKDPVTCKSCLRSPRLEETPEDEE